MVVEHIAMTRVCVACYTHKLLVKLLSTAAVGAAWNNTYTRVVNYCLVHSATPLCTQAASQTNASSIPNIIMKSIFPQGLWTNPPPPPPPQRNESIRCKTGSYTYVCSTSTLNYHNLVKNDCEIKTNSYLFHFR